MTPKAIRQSEAARRLGMSRQLLAHHIKQGRVGTIVEPATGVRLVTLASLARFQRTREEGGK